MLVNDRVKHAAGGHGTVTAITAKGIYVAFDGPEHGSNLFEPSRICEPCKIVFPTEAVKTLHVGAGHKLDIPYRG